MALRPVPVPHLVNAHATNDGGLTPDARSSNEALGDVLAFWGDLENHARRFDGVGVVGDSQVLQSQSVDVTARLLAFNNLDNPPSDFYPGVHVSRIEYQNPHSGVPTHVANLPSLRL